METAHFFSKIKTLQSKLSKITEALHIKGNILYGFSLLCYTPLVYKYQQVRPYVVPA